MFESSWPQSLLTSTAVAPVGKSAIVANGEINDYTAIGGALRSFSMVVAADGGLRHCQQMGIVPSLIVGDLDSVSPSLLEGYAEVPKKTFPPNKDKTDMELAIEEVLGMGGETVGLFGALGGRIDHTLYNVYLLQRYPGKVFIETEREILSVIDKEAAVASFPGQTVSLLPLGGAVTGITTRGLKWELSDARFDKSWMSLSNICLGDAFRVEISEGSLLCCQTKSL